jgi:hypothetical protein
VIDEAGYVTMTSRLQEIIAAGRRDPQAFA